jgi:syntaxin 18
LSTAQAPRRLQPVRTDSTGKLGHQKKTQFLTERQKDEIDAQAKQLIRELNAGIRNLADAEQLRQNTETTLSRKKYARLGLGALGSWAAGGAGQTKSYEQELDEAKTNAIKMHRESVLWYLRQKLQETGSFQASIMETRIIREMEKKNSVLRLTRAKRMPELGGFDAPAPPTSYKGNPDLLREEQSPDVNDDLTPEQLQMYEKEEQALRKQYEATLKQVLYVLRFLPTIIRF